MSQTLSFYLTLQNDLHLNEIASLMRVNFSLYELLFFYLNYIIVVILCEGIIIMIRLYRTEDHFVLKSLVSFRLSIFNSAHFKRCERFIKEKNHMLLFVMLKDGNI